MSEYIITQCGDGGIGKRIENPETNEFGGIGYVLRLPSLVEKS